MSESARGSCVCGAVAFRIDGPFLRFQYCHCSRCRKKSGATAAANIFVPTGQLTWERGEGNVRRFELPDTKYWSTCFCSDCGSAMPWLSRTGKAYIVPAGALDGDPGIRPNYSIYYGSRAPWHVDPSELEKHETLPER